MSRFGESKSAERCGWQRKAKPVTPMDRIDGSMGFSVIGSCWRLFHHRPPMALEASRTLRIEGSVGDVSEAEDEIRLWGHPTKKTQTMRVMHALRIGVSKLITTEIGPKPNQKAIRTPPQICLLVFSRPQSKQHALCAILCDPCCYNILPLSMEDKRDWASSIGRVVRITRYAHLRSTRHTDTSKYRDPRELHAEPNQHSFATQGWQIGIWWWFERIWEWLKWLWVRDLGFGRRRKSSSDLVGSWRIYKELERIGGICFLCGPNR